MPLCQELPGEGELNLNLGMEPAVGIRWRRPRAAVLGKRWGGVLPGPAACTVRGCRASCQPRTLVSSSAAARQQGPWLCGALVSSSAQRGSLSCPPHECADQKRRWKRAALCRERELGSSVWERTQALCCHSCWTSGRLLELPVPQFSQLPVHGVM